MPDIRTFDMPTVDRVVQGPGAMKLVGDEMNKRNYERAFLVTGRSIGSGQPFRDLVDNLGDRVAGVFDTVQAHNPVDLVVEIVGQARAADANVIVGVGGGSPVDAAKLAAIGVTHDVQTTEDLAKFYLKFTYPSTIEVRPLDTKPLPVFAIPTTLSAAEWDGFAGCVDHERDTKEIAVYRETTPEVVFLDPELASHTPRDLWTTTGVRALDHAVETAYAINAHPFTTALANGALALLATYLPRSAKDPHDYEAAQQCQIAAWMSIIGVHNVSLGLSHGIGHQLGALGVPHGVTSCIMLTHVMRFLEPATTEAQHRMAATLAEAGLAKPGESAADALDRLLDELQVPRKVSDFNIPRNKMDAVVTAALGDIVIRESPRPVDRKVIKDLLELAW
jgi:alcohol dehydrogenase class IV